MNQLKNYNNYKGLPEIAENMLDEIPGKGNRRMKFNKKTEETNIDDISRSDSPEDDIDEMVNQTDNAKDMSEDTGNLIHISIPAICNHFILMSLCK